MLLRWLLTGWLVAGGATALSPADLAPVHWSGPSADLTLRKVTPGLITRAQIHKDDAFLAVPRVKEGLAATLLRGSLRPKDRGRLEPYPAWKPQTEGDCNCLQSVVDLFLDPAGVLWALDTGTAHRRDRPPHEDTRVHCPPKIVAFDVATGRIEKEINLFKLVSPDSKPQFIVTDYTPEGDCFVFVSDAGNSTIIIYNLAADKGYTVPLPKEAIPQSKDVLYLSLIRRPSSGDTFLYFTYRSGKDIFYIDSRTLQSELSLEKAQKAGEKPGKLIFLGTDDWEAEYMRFENQTEVYKWNTSTELSEKNFQLVDRGRTGLIPTHALADYKRGVMRLMESNIVRYLHEGAKTEDAINTLKTMQLD